MSMSNFQILSKIGEGAFSIVYKVRRLTDNTEYALKKVKMGGLSAKEKENALNEIRILASFMHPNIITYKEAFFEDSSNSLCLVMEYADGGDLYAKIIEHQKRNTHFSEEDLWKIFVQTLKGLKVLHEHKILHRDLKSANVFLTKNGEAKLGDLNVSKIAKKGLLYTQTGTPYYASPEVWKDQPYDTKSDLWSLGCVLYEAATLKPPFRAQSMEALNQKVQKGIYAKIPSTYSEELWEVIKLLLQVAPKNRPSCEELLKKPIIKKRLKEEEEEAQLNEVLAKGGLLGTIQLPRNLNILKDKLPKPNYKEAQKPTLPPVRNKSLSVDKGLVDYYQQYYRSPYYVEMQKEDEVKYKKPVRVEYSVSPKRTPLAEQDSPIKLPDIRKAVGPIRKPPPRINPYYGHEEDEFVQNYMPVAGRPSPYYRRAYGVNYQEKPKDSRRKQIGENVKKVLPYYLNVKRELYEDKVMPPRIYVAGNSPYNIGKQHIIVKPSWWG